MTRKLILAAPVLLLAACTQEQLTNPSAQMLFQGSLGELEQAQQANPALAAKVDAYRVAAKPWLEAVAKGAADAATSKSLTDLANQAALDALPYIVVRPAKAAP